MNVRTSTSIAALLCAAAVYSGQAGACDLMDLRNATATAASAQFAAAIAAKMQQGGIDNINARPPRGAIVGLWKFAFTAPDGVSSIDWGFQAWHDDGIEITNSGGRPAKNGNFCMGAWTEHGAGHYVLNHWAIAWGLPPDFDENTLSGLVNIRENVNVDHSGNTMTGTVSLDLYAEDGETLLAHIVDGTVAGTRVEAE
jgi:hypothetical protein